MKVLGGSSNLQSFNFGNREVVEFFTNLYELMMTLDPKSNITWTSIDVLLEACHCRNARDSLIHTFRFVPILTKMLDSNLILEKKVKILQLMQVPYFNYEIIFFYFVGLMSNNIIINLLR